MTLLELMALRHLDPNRVPEITQDTVSLVVGTTEGRLLEYNPNRIAIMLGGNGTSYYHLDLNNAISTTHGLVLTPTNPNLSVSDLSMPFLAAQEWWGISNGASAQITIISTYLLQV